MPIDTKYTSAVSRRRGPREHINCDQGQVGAFVLLPGDPGRVPLIAELLEDAHEVAFRREFRTFTGRLGEAAVSVTSTGIGGPSAAIAVEELVQLGAHTFIRVGTAGALQPDVHVGEVVVATGAVRDEGTTRAYVPIEFPAVSNTDVVSALIMSAKRAEVPFRVGVVHSKDSFYGQHEPDRMPTAPSLRDRYSAWERAGALCSEMETAAVLVVASTLGVRAASVIAIAGNQVAGEHLDQPGVSERRDRAVANAAACAVGAVRELISADAGPLT